MVLSVITLVFVFRWSCGFCQSITGSNNKSPPCGLLHSNELYNNPNLVNEFPWVVGLKRERDGNFSESREDDGSGLCIGALINNRFVLTSGSCVDGEGLKMNVTSVRVGNYNTGIECVKNLQSDDCTASTVDVPVENVLIFPEYNSTTLENNLALLQLAENVTFTEYVRPICLLSSSRTNRSESQDEFWTSGYLQDDPSKIIKSGNRVVIGEEECGSYLNDSLRSTKNCFCASEGTKGGPCILDAGGPLAFPDGVQWYQEGISSFSTDCTAPDAITSYTRISNYIDWIKETSEMEP